jgi:NAD(P)-dependent dehydrogenase (short-subunit alcohol dehydrogenase family)
VTMLPGLCCCLVCDIFAPGWLVAGATEATLRTADQTMRFRKTAGRFRKAAGILQRPGLLACCGSATHCREEQMGTSEEVANLVLLLLCDESGNITGAEVAIDGGATL